MKIENRIDFTEWALLASSPSGLSRRSDVSVKKGGRVSGMRDVLALGASDITLTPAVERDENAIPRAWRIFKNGENEIFKNGERFILNFSGEVFDAIIANFAARGNKIPLDSNHFLYRLAEHYGTTEDEILKVLPDGRGTFGFGSLEKRSDGLWLTDVEYVPMAEKLMADGTFRYFSPVIRGLADAKFRVTSVTMENTPAMTRLDSLAASEYENETPFENVEQVNERLDVIAMSADNKSGNTSRGKKETDMKKLLTAVCGLVGLDAIALGENEAVPENILAKLKEYGIEHDALKASKTASDAFLSDVRASLALGAESDVETVKAALTGVLKKAEGHDALREKVDALALAAENDKKSKLIEAAFADGKLVENQKEWAESLTSVALSAFLEKAPANPAIATKLKLKDLPDPDSVALSEEDKNVAAKLGISEEDMLKQKKGE